MSDVPPPPGGYGLDPSGHAPRGPYRSPGAPEPPPSFTPPPRNGGRWAVGGVGLALIGIRILLLCARASSSPSYEFTPSTLPTSYGDDPFAALFDAGQAAPTARAVGPMALASGDHAVYVDSRLHLVDAADPSHSLGRALATDLAVTKDRVIWLDMLDGEIAAVPRAGGAKSTVADALVSPTNLRADEMFAYVVDDDAGNEDNRAVEKIALGTGKVTQLASVAGVVSALELDAASVYIAWSTADAGTTTYHLRRVPKTGGVGGDVTTFRADDAEGASFTHMALGGGYVYYTHSGNLDRVRVTGGATEHVYAALDGDFDELGPLAADGEAVYFAHRMNFGSWSVARIVRPGGKVEELAQGLAVMPSAVVAGKSDVFYTTASGVAHVPKHPTSASE